MRSQQIMIDNGPLTGNNNYALNGSKWDHTTLKYYIHNSSSHLTAYIRETAISNALQTWASVSPLSFQQTNNESDADLIFKWATGEHGDWNPFDGSLGILAHAFYPPLVGGIFAGQVHFDDSEDWTSDETNTSVDLESIALHEIGHALGICHSSYSNASMYPYYSIGSIKRQLNDDDKVAIWDLYGDSANIIGDSIPTSSSVYYIGNLPECLSVSWTWKNGSSPSILEDVPSTNKCTILNTDKSYINDTLIATITYGDDTIAISRKAINTGVNFAGTYEQAAFQFGNWSSNGTPSTSFQSGDIINLYKRETITLSSQNFIGAIITYSGTLPLDWTNNNGVITFHFKYLAPINPRNPLNPQLVTLESTSAELTITGRYPNSYETFQFTVRGHDPGILFQSPSLHNISVNYEGSILNVSLSKASSRSDPIDSLVESFNTDDVPWEISIYNFTTGHIIFESKETFATIHIDTQTWDSGIYLIKAKVGQEMLSKKIKIKK